jgi:hypothetical protein
MIPLKRRDVATADTQRWGPPARMNPYLAAPIHPESAAVQRMRSPVCPTFDRISVLWRGRTARPGSNLRRPSWTAIGRMAVLVVHPAPVECALGGVRQGGDDLDPIRLFEPGQLASAAPKDLFCGHGLRRGYDDGANPLPILRVRDGGNGCLGDTAATRENCLRDRYARCCQLPRLSPSDKRG